MPLPGQSQIHDFKTLFIGVRPARVAVLMNSEDGDWKNTCLRIIECLSTVWGGEYNVIVPTDGIVISERFWSVLEVFDPDHIYMYRKTGEDLKALSPDKFSGLVEDAVQRFAHANRGTDLARIRTYFEKDFSQAFGEQFDISQSLQDELRDRLAPLYFENHVVQHHLYANILPGYPLTSMHKVLRYCDHPPRVVEPHISLPEIPALWLSSVVGKLSPASKGALSEVGLEVSQIDYGEDQASELFDIGLGGSTYPLSAFAYSMSQLAYHTHARVRDWEDPIVVVAGDSLRDYCLYQCISRLRYRVAWLLPSWTAAFEAAKLRKQNGGPGLAGAELFAFYFSHSLLNAARSNVADRKIVFISESLGAEEIKRIVALLDEALLMATQDILGRSRVRDSIAELLVHPKIVYERDNAGRPRTQQFMDHSSIGFLETPKPLHFTSVVPSEHRWMAEVTVRGQSYPQHPKLGGIIVQGMSVPTVEARSGRNGIAYFCPNSIVFSSDIDSVLVKPTLFLPDVFEIIQRVARSTGLHCDLSDKGYYLAETIRKFGSLEQLGSFLKDKKKRLALDKYLDNTGPTEGVKDEGVFLRSDRRRYLNFQALEKILGTREEVKKLLDQLIPQSLLYRGLVLKCQFCRNSDWFSIDEIAHQFICKRCSRSQTVASRHWREPEEPAWYYKLDEIVYQAHSNNMAVTALALHSFQQKKTDSFMYTTDLEFSEMPSGPPKQEIDICCILDGRLYLGEAKKEDSLGANSVEDARIAGRYLALARRLATRDVVFATFATQWSGRTKTEIERAFSDSQARVHLLEGAELL